MSTTKRDLVPCVGGPWDGEASAVSLNGEALMRRDDGAYLLDEDERGEPIYRWHPTTEGGAD